VSVNKSAINPGNRKLRSAHSFPSKWDSDSSDAVVWQAGGIDPIP